MSSQKAFSLVVVLCAALSLTLVSGCGDHQESFYPTVADADKAGAITQGWVPDDIIPKSSRNIRVIGELSPSKEWCAFEFPAADAGSLRKSLTAVDALPPAVARVSNPGVSWWPEVLRGSLNVEKINNAGFQLYVVERPATSVNMGIYLFALDWSKGHGFFYWTYRS